MINLRIGTRGSKLALTQTRMVASALEAAHPGLKVEIIEIQTSGDWKPEQGETRLSEVEGGKGLFAREIERAILDGVVDCGVHSLKDMPSFLPEGLVIHHVLPRAAVEDVLLSNTPIRNVSDIPAGAVIGTSSLRRQAFLLRHRPDLKIKPLRGNVPTRIEKMRDGQVDCAVLARAGLERLGLFDPSFVVLGADVMLPAAAQGIVGIEIRDGDEKTAALFDAIHHTETGYVAAAERAALATLDGSCHTPIGAYAVLSDGQLHLKVAVASADGASYYEDEQTGPVASDAEARHLGQLVGLRLKSRVPADIFL